MPFKGTRFGPEMSGSIVDGRALQKGIQWLFGSKAGTATGSLRS